jgi:hypothetical protein
MGATTQLGGTHVKKLKKIFLEMIPLGVKTCGEFEFDIFEAKKHFPDSGKACVLKRKVAKIAFLRGLDLGLSSFLRFFSYIVAPNDERYLKFSSQSTKLSNIEIYWLVYSNIKKSILCIFTNHSPMVLV